jgi:ferrous iron transport protein A
MNATPLKLSTQSNGTRAQISGFSLPDEIEQRLQKMGMTVGADVRVVRRAPLGDPLEVRIRGFLLAIRASEADGVFVKIIE